MRFIGARGQLIGQARGKDAMNWDVATLFGRIREMSGNREKQCIGEQSNSLGRHSTQSGFCRGMTWGWLPVAFALFQFAALTRERLRTESNQ